MMRSRAIFLALGLVAALGAGCAKKPTTTQFVSDAVQANIAEVKLGQLALEKATRPEVKDYAQTLVTDHTAAQAQAEALATQLGLTPPAEESAKAKADYDRLAKLTGDDFDKAFVRYTVDDHKADIAEFSQAASASDERISRFANDTLPVLKRHLEAAQALQGKS